MRLSTALPADYFGDPFASALHKAAGRAYRRDRFPRGLASPSWYRDASLTVSEPSTIAE
jgi:hypothetical protein